MSTSRFGRTQKAMALVPLTMLSAAWTASLAGVGPGTPAVAEDQGHTLPDGTSVPATAFDTPASLSNPDGGARAVVAGSSASGIPAAALAAYQRAESVINEADPACGLPWQLLAAIGRVESDHGRYGGNTLDTEGVARPGIVGIALDGTRGTAAIADSDAGRFDGDTAHDRAVGPMQFIPSTWLVVGVDADGDGERNPQDIDDAALAAAVYLCAGTDDLSTDTGRRAAVYRYNHSESYVDLVLSILAAYLSGDFTSVPTSTTSASYFPTIGGDGPRDKDRGRDNGPRPGPGDLDDTPTTADDGDDPVATPPSDGPDPGDTDPVDSGTQDPVEAVTSAASDPTGTVDDVLTYAEAALECTSQGLVDNPLDDNDPFDQCMAGYGY